ncbi:related to methylcrotonyl-coa carboxylase alpha chain, mitochondrial precursor [Phialocephala subalpina]|uniref:Related to methylcrotonyl-coa carboxylase alpha chain, mitochondrial n=1 Tax=Phialocephala subalpina TaxID=576137 RepID=A0A1L7WPX0_9HELO|nr:related to methylcrotonyl-coa carboxylase alpha chain, mitochondrial precursor [Phialocephala subalpina]
MSPNVRDSRDTASTTPRSNPRKLPERLCDQLTDANGDPVVKRVLIANRGEIACRVIATCRKLNITSIAVYTEPDAQSLHVKQADQSVLLGAVDSPDGNPHQNIDLLIKTALLHKADAVHPGYGYLSENPEFSKRVTEAGILFLGPTANSMAVLGDKRLAKEYLANNATHIPLIPGYNGSEQSIERLLVEADRIGFPILIKASAGGGGKGMRIVHHRDQLEAELTRAQSEATRSFGSADCILERYIQRSKHVEMQIFGDRHGVVVSLLDRECSIQRRHQKVIEEAPSPWLSAELRSRMSETAISIGDLLKYESAGTVEFIIDVETAEFFFLEVNTRIQVEHPITEETVGLDIVALQIYAASGGKLDDLEYFENGSPPQVGHAIEVRLCAEDPLRDFLPDLGVIQRWTPASEILPLSQTQNVRFETGIQTGSEVSIYFDSLIAKIVVWAPTRAQAIAKMLKMLANTVCIGIRSNQAFLQSCLAHPSFADPAYSTSFIPELMEELLKNPYTADVPALLNQLSFAPSLLRRQTLSTQSGYGKRSAFSSIRPGYRNQKADTANVTADIIQIQGQYSETLIVEWPAAELELNTPQSVNIAPLAQNVESTAPTAEERKPGLQLALDYNAISAQIRSLKSKGSSAVSHKVSLRTIKSHTAPGPNNAYYDLHDLLLTTDLTHQTIYTSSSSTNKSHDAGAYQTIYAHIPALGTHVEFRVFPSLLNYGESLRGSSEEQAALADKNAKAPMPCRVLDVVGKDGEHIEVGQVGMIVESMKMEMKVLATVAGTFKGMFKIGDAVDEGSVLFSVT